MSAVFSARPLVVGHRGGRGPTWPTENTLEAFERAWEEGVWAVELDVRTCRDGEIVVLHDANLARVTNGRDAREVSKLPYAEIARVGLGENGGGAVPLLADILSWAEGRGVGVNVELKHDVPSRAALARGVARVLRTSRAEVLLSSFDPVLVALMAALAPRVPRAILTHGKQGLPGAAIHRLARRGLVDAIHVERTEADPRAISEWKRRGLHVGVWTVNDPREARELLDLGVDYLITDDPAALGIGEPYL